jgi:Flp pilus assembly pilin Flp
MTTTEANLTNACSTSSLANDQRGLTTVEYVIVLVLIAVVGIGVWRTFGKNLSTKISDAANSVQGL